MKIIIVLICSLLVLVSSSSCERKDCGFGGPYLFEMKAELSPKQDTFKVGDTITVVSEFDDNVFERNTQTSYKLEDFPFYPIISFVELDTIPIFMSVRNFRFIFPSSFNFNIAYLDRGTSFVKGTYLYEKKDYKLQFKFIPRRAGLFGFGLGSTLQPLEGDQDFPGRCGKKESDAYVVLNNGEENNIQMLQFSADTAHANWLLEKPQQRFHDKGVYVFYVKE